VVPNLPHLPPTLVFKVVFFCVILAVMTVQLGGYCCRFIISGYKVIQLKEVTENKAMQEEGREGRREGRGIRGCGKRGGGGRRGVYSA